MRYPRSCDFGEISVNDHGAHSASVLLQYLLPVVILIEIYQNVSNFPHFILPECRLNFTKVISSEVNRLNNKCSSAL